jgi:hypothetical protein
MAGTRWVRLDAGYFRNSKVLQAGRDGRALHLASICWSGGEESDGVIPPWALPTLLHDAGVPRRAVDALIAAGLWVPSENGVGGWVIHDYLSLQPSREELEAERARWAKNKREWRAKKAKESTAMSTGVSTVDSSKTPRWSLHPYET